MTDPKTLTAAGVVALVAFGLLALLIHVGAEAFAGRGYAALMPDPESQIWRVDDGATVWLQTGEETVTVEIGSRHLGFGDIEVLDRSTGQRTVLGRARGCRQAADPETGVLDLSAGVGVELLGCSQTPAGTPTPVTLSGPGGEEYSVYRVAVAAAATANTAPAFASASLSRTLSWWDKPAGTPVGAPITATDAGDVLTYTIEEVGHYRLFRVGGSTGQITTDALLEQGTAYSISLIATDGGGLTDSVDVTIQTSS